MDILLLTEKPFSKETVGMMKRTISDAGHNLLVFENHGDRKMLLGILKYIDVIIVRSDVVDKEMIDAAEKLKLIIRAGSGWDNIDVSECTKRGIVIETTPGKNANAVAEMIILLILLNARNHLDGSVGYEISEKTLGVDGLGNIGGLIAKKALGLGMKVYAYDPFKSKEYIQSLGIIPVKNRAELYRKCQHISVNIPHNSDTEYSIGKELLMSMPENAVLVNTARGKIMEHNELKYALGQRKDLTYISDVELENRDYLANNYEKTRVFFTVKKQGAQTREANNACGIAAADQVIEFFKTGESIFRIN